MHIENSRIIPIYLASAILAGFGIAQAQVPSAADRPGTESIVPYGLVKKDLSQVQSRDEVQFALPRQLYPQRGVLFVRGGMFISTAINWTIVDFDTRAISRVLSKTQILPDGTSELILTSKISRDMTAPELNKIIEASNLVWAPPPEPPRPMGHPPTDSFCDITLFDREYARRGYGLGCPWPDLVKAIESIKLPDPR